MRSKKAVTVFLVLIVIVVFPTTPVIAAKGKYAIEIGNQMVSLSYIRPPSERVYWGGGLSVWFCGGGTANYTLFEGEPLEWWNYQKNYIKGSAWELYLRMGADISPSLLMELGVGYTQQQIVEMYKSTATGWYFGKERFESYGTFLGALSYHFRRYYVTIGYHSPYGMTAGVGWEW